MYIRYNLEEIKKNISLAQWMEKEVIVPWKDFGTFFEARVARYGDKEYLACYGARGSRTGLTYRELGLAVNRTARFLKEGLGIGRGDRVATFMNNHHSAVIVYFACWLVGACIVPCDVEKTPDLNSFIVEHSDAKIIVSDLDYLGEAVTVKERIPAVKEVVRVGGHNVGSPSRSIELADEMSSEVTDFFSHAVTCLDDDAVLIYNPCGQGKPTGVLLTQKNLLVGADAICTHHRFSSIDKFMSLFPLSHVNSIVITLVTPFYAGGCVVICGDLPPVNFWEMVHSEKITYVNASPGLIEKLLASKQDISHYNLGQLRSFICGGALGVGEAVEFEKRFGFPIVNGYGLPETTCLACSLPVDLTKEERLHWLSRYGVPSIGVAVSHNRMAILSPKGRELPEMEKGQIAIRGAAIMKEYYKRPDANSMAFKYGWFLSGNEGFYKRDEHGRKFFFLTGRIKG